MIKQKNSRDNANEIVTGANQLSICRFVPLPRAKVKYGNTLHLKWMTATEF